jgi:hypothetical protein
MPGHSGHACPRSMNPLPAHPYFCHCAHLNRTGPDLSWATWLCGRNDLFGQLSARHAFNMTWGLTTVQSLIDTRGDRHAHKTSMSCCLSITKSCTISVHLSTHGYFYDSKYSQPWPEIPYISQVTGNHLTSIELSMAKHVFDPRPI